VRSQSAGILTVTAHRGTALHCTYYRGGVRNSIAFKQYPSMEAAHCSVTALHCKVRGTYYSR
jgi:hypothetical protein